MGKNIVTLIHLDDFDAIVNKPLEAVCRIEQCIATGQKNTVSVNDEGALHADVITVMPPIDSRETIMYIAMGNGIHAVTAGGIQRNPLLLKNLLEYLREELHMKIQKNPFE